LIQLKQRRFSALTRRPSGLAYQALFGQRREVFELGRKILVHPYAAAIARGSAAVKSHINGSNDARARDRRGMRECRARLP